MKSIIYLELIRLIKSVKFFFHFIYYFDRVLKILNFKKNLKNKKIVLIGGSKLNIKKLNYYISKKRTYSASLNSYALTKIAKKIKPDFYFLLDPFFFKHSKSNVKILNYVKKNNICLVLPLQISNEQKRNIDAFKILKITYINASFSRILGFINPILPRSFSGMTLLSMLSFFLSLGSSKIYLIGFMSDLFKGLRIDKKNIGQLNYKTWGKSNVNKRTFKISNFLMGFSLFFHDCDRIENKFPYQVFNLDDKSFITSFKKI
jgi:hypothetical protein